MKKIKTVISLLLAIIMACGAFTLSAFALPEFSDVVWNDDYSVDYNFDGADEYHWDVYINNSMVWGYSIKHDNIITREKMIPYLTELADYSIKEEGYSGNVSFDLHIIAMKDGYGISKEAVISKTLKIEDVAAGKLSPESEQWQFSVSDTSDNVKLSQAFHAALDPDKAAISEALMKTGVSYDQYILFLASSASTAGRYTFTGTLAQAMRFGKVYYSNSAYTHVKLLITEPENEKIKNIDITLPSPTHGKSAIGYLSSVNIATGTQGAKVRTKADQFWAFETNTNTYPEKMYCGNEIVVTFFISFEEGYEADEDFTVKVNGNNALNISELSELDGVEGYYAYATVKVEGNFFQKIVTFFHNLIMKIKHPNGMPM